MTEERLTDLELRYTLQQDLIEKLDGALLEANQTIDVLEKRVARLEQTLEQVLHLVDVPVNEKPPHY